LADDFQHTVSDPTGGEGFVVWVSSEELAVLCF
jgi:hypothetical protein